MTDCGGVNFVSEQFKMRIEGISREGIKLTKKCIFCTLNSPRALTNYSVSQDGRSKIGSINNRIKDNQNKYSCYKLPSR